MQGWPFGWDELKLSKDVDRYRKKESVAMLYLPYHHGQETEEGSVRLVAELTKKGRIIKGPRSGRKRGSQSNG